ncbi:hypothetical protein ATANTOWER_011611 [Ataeniobius toweri]|uniref:Uncharacterized protein n=1 Tax=Ataeniobius toweri TaxID=208326 RepID=A0ABU7A5R5_9TELE|nr:hypothetical protein [Ataeniobius toweri]
MVAQLVALLPCSKMVLGSIPNWGSFCMFSPCMRGFSPAAATAQTFTFRGDQLCYRCRGQHDDSGYVQVKLVKATTPEVLDIEEAVVGLSVVLPFDIKTCSGSASSFSGTGYSATQDAAIAQMVTDLLRLSPYGSRPLLQPHWSSPHVPMGMVETHPVYPSSLIVHTNTGYRRARDFRTDSKYTKDTFD